MGTSHANDGPLDVLSRESLDRIASAAAGLLDVPLVLISVFDGPRQIYVGSHGLATMRADEPSPVCRDVATSNRPIMMQDARRRLPSAARGVWGFDLVAYAGVPLNPTEPARMGAFAALTPARRAWQSQDLQVLRCLADAAGAVLDMQAACQAIVGDARRTLELDTASLHDELTGLVDS